MLILVVYIIVLAVYFSCPKYLRLVMLIANFFVPDAVPIIDEAIMVAGLLAPSN